MSTFKCKMCGGQLIIDPESTVSECEYCGSKQTIPVADNEKKMTLFTRANRLRFNNEFDKAASVYESIVAEFPEEAEAYWGLILCKYGIEYVDDPATAKKVPTCHRSSFESVMDDQNFELVMEYAETMAKRVYREEAKQIEELRKGIIEISGKEEPYDIFICYKETDEDGNRTLDSVLAQDVYNALTEKGYRVFFSRISLEDKLGQEYEPYIFAALHSAKIMLAFGTDYEYYEAVWVKNEWSRFLKLIAAGEKKTLIPCFKNLDAYDMPKEFSRLQAQDMGKVGAIQDLLRGIEKIIGGKQESVSSAPETTLAYQPVGGSNLTSLMKRGNMYLEDHAWDKASEYFERILDLDAEYAQAYLGKAMAEYHAFDCRSFGNELLKRVKPPQISTLQIKAETEHIQEMVSECLILPDLCESVIMEAYSEFNRSYPAATPDAVRYSNDVHAEIEGNRNIVRYKQFADNSELASFEQMCSAIYQQVDQIVADAQLADEKAQNTAQENYREFLQKKDAEVREQAQFIRDRIAKNETTYTQILAEMEEARRTGNEAVFNEIRSKLSSLGGFRDAQIKLNAWNQFCEEYSQRTSKYEKASSLFDEGSCSSKRTMIIQAKEEFDSLGNFRDSEARSKECLDTLEKWNWETTNMIKRLESSSVLNEKAPELFKDYCRAIKLAYGQERERMLHGMAHYITRKQAMLLEQHVMHTSSRRMEKLHKHTIEKIQAEMNELKKIRTSNLELAKICREIDHR